LKVSSKRDVLNALIQQGFSKEVAQVYTKHNCDVISEVRQLEVWAIEACDL